ncbi:dUTP diphosphatase [Corynebacterium liangguodongii]|uniref:dUTP diphosphatase n=2 Tax=Corynebacterium liangguodongii TaxID=2079535 RepID=A0A2S0WHB6_9CORY|nr:dUTP diphosphatase [Corynebacterium liangguodongii]PWB99246.1 dUTP diphosphatase [Corynebacterium liangguodongii]
MEQPRVMRLHEAALLPTRAHEWDAGWDVHADETVVIRPGETVKVRTGIAVGVPVGQVCDVRSRSGLASRGVVVANSPGTIDAGYVGEVCVLLHNQVRELHRVNRGDRIAQLVFLPINTTPLREVNALDESERGGAGFGSTGK